MLIVDDEALARERLRTLLQEEHDVEIVGEAPDGETAIELIRSLKPDVVFLDVQMPGLDGFDVITEIGAEQMPVIVFATAYDEFALRAFDLNAIDYLLKPIGPERLGGTLARLRERAEGPRVRQFQGEFLRWLKERQAEAEAYRGRFAVKTGTSFEVLRASDIVLVEGADNYVRLHTPKGSYLYRSTIAHMEAVLDPARFLRVHRSYVLNVEAVQKIEPFGMGEFLFQLTTGQKVSSTRRYRRGIRAAFGC